MRVASVPGAPMFKGEEEWEEPAVKAEKEPAPVDTEQTP